MHTHTYKHIYVCLRGVSITDICMYVCVCIYIYIYINACMQTCMHLCTYV